MVISVKPIVTGNTGFTGANSEPYINKLATVIAEKPG